MVKSFLLVTPALVARPTPSPACTFDKVDKDEGTSIETPAQPSNSKVSRSSLPLVDSVIAKASFPSRLASPKVEDKDEEILEMFEKV